MLSLLAINFHTARLGLEAQNAMVFRFLKLFSGTNETKGPEILAGEIALAPSAQAPAKVVTVKSDRRKRRTSVRKVKKDGAQQAVSSLPRPSSPQGGLFLKQRSSLEVC